MTDRLAGLAKAKDVFMVVGVIEREELTGNLMCVREVLYLIALQVLCIVVLLTLTLIKAMLASIEKVKW